MIATKPKSTRADTLRSVITSEDLKRLTVTFIDDWVTNPSADDPHAIWAFAECDFAFEGIPITSGAKRALAHGVKPERVDTRVCGSATITGKELAANKGRDIGRLKRVQLEFAENSVRDLIEQEFLITKRVGVPDGNGGTRWYFPVRILT